jgi:hypothetical protein
MSKMHTRVFWATFSEERGTTWGKDQRAAQASRGKPTVPLCARNRQKEAQIDSKSWDIRAK